jgi:hypothetical protein
MQFSKSDGRKRGRHQQNEATQPDGSVPDYQMQQFLPGSYHLLEVCVSRSKQKTHPNSIRNKPTPRTEASSTQIKPSAISILGARAFSNRNTQQGGDSAKAVPKAIPDLQAAAA